MNRLRLIIFCALLGVCVWAAPVFWMHPGEKIGIASWFKTDLEKNPAGSVCAANDWPKGTFLKVTNIQNGRHVFCRVATQGPPRKWGRLVDLSESSFRRIADPRAGLAWVRVKPIHRKS